MATTLVLLFAMAAAASLISPCLAKCSIETFSEDRVYSLCNTLPRLSSSLHWNYYQANRTVDLAFRARLSPPGWVAWGINPSGARMIGTQALIAVVSASGNVTAYTSPITSYSPTMKKENLSFTVTSISATYSSGIVTIFAVISLPGNSTLVNHVWQSSSILSGDVPGGHLPFGDNVLSIGTLDLLSGDSPAASRYLHRRNVHVILCVVGWGVLTPIGVLIYRYIPIMLLNCAFILVQLASYIMGVVGWAYGLVLGRDSVGIIHEKHLIIGTLIFCLAVLKGSVYNMDASIIGGTDGHLLSIALIVLIVINIFEGFSILGGHEKWRIAYIAFISAIGGLFVILEVLYWIFFPKISRAIARILSVQQA